MQWLLDWDAALFRWANAPRGATIDALLLAAAWAGEYALVWYLLAMLLLARRRRWDWRLVGVMTAAALLSLAATNVWKLVWDRPRPFEYLENVRQLGQTWANSAFPSGHAVSSFALATVLGRAEPRWRPWLYALAALVCISRPYCGMHHPLDVLAGVLFGLGVGRLVVRWSERPLKRLSPGDR